MSVFPKQRELRIVEVAEPKLQDEHDVLVECARSAFPAPIAEICEFHYGTPPAGDDGLVLGHEELGEVVDVGPAVQTLEPGDLVALTVRRPARTPSAWRVEWGDRTSARPAISESAGSTEPTAS